MAKKTHPSPDIPVPERTNPRNVQSVYVNSMGMTASAMDVRLIFSEVGIEGKVHTMEERANIVMSLPHFKAMLNVMLNNLPIIEKSEADAQAALLAEKPN